MLFLIIYDFISFYSLIHQQILSVKLYYVFILAFEFQVGIRG